MSVSGIFQDLTVREVIQLFAAAGRTGVLEVTGEQNAVWVALDAGGITRVALAEGLGDAKETLLAAGVEPGSEDAAVEERCLRVAVAEAVVDQLSWREGEFSYEPDQDPELDWQGPEGVRFRRPQRFEKLSDPLRAAETEAPLAAAPSTAATPTAQAPEAPWVPSAGIQPLSLGPSGAGRSERRDEKSPLVIAVDAEQSFFDHVQQALGRLADRIHVFRDGRQALADLERALARDERPVIALSSDARDPQEGSAGASGDGAGWEALAARVRTLSPQVAVILLTRGSGASHPAADWVMQRPASGAGDVDEVEAFLEDLADLVGPAK